MTDGEQSDEKKEPGILFLHHGAAESRVEGRLRVRLTLECEVTDEALWRQVEKKFQAGYRVYTTNDLQDEVVDVLREEVRRLERSLKDKDFELSSLRSKSSLDNEELAKYKGMLSALGSGIRGG